MFVIHIDDFFTHCECTADNPTVAHSFLGCRQQANSNKCRYQQAYAFTTSGICKLRSLAIRFRTPELTCRCYFFFFFLVYLIAALYRQTKVSIRLRQNQRVFIMVMVLLQRFCSCFVPPISEIAFLAFETSARLLHLQAPRECNSSLHHKRCVIY